MAGCSGFEVQLDGEVTPVAMERTAVLDFTQEPIEKEVNDRWLLWSLVRSRTAGADVADLTSRLLEGWEMAEVFDRHTLRALVRHKRISGNLAEPPGREELKRLLGAKTVVVGEVEEYGYRYVFPSYQRAFASLSVRCIDLDTNEVLWAFHGSGSRHWTHARAVVTEILKRGLHQVRTRLRPDESSASPADPTE